MSKKLCILIAVFIFLNLLLPSVVTSDCNGVNNVSPCSTTVIVFGLFPNLSDFNITYLALNPLRWETISADRFIGYRNKLIIVGLYKIVEPIAGFTYEPMEDKLRVKENPIFFTITSDDPDDIIMEQWWQFEESGPWIMAENPSYIYHESGYHNVTLRIIGDYGLNDTYMKRIRVYERLPKYQCEMDLHAGTLRIVGYSVVGSYANYDWVDFENVGSGSCTLPNSGHPNIGDIITNCVGEIKLQYIPNGVIAGEWQF